MAILDCPPGITLTSESVFSAADALLVPTIPTPLSKRTLDQLSEFLADQPAPPVILPFASIVDRRKKLQRELAAALAAETPDFLPTVIPNAERPRADGRRTRTHRHVRTEQRGGRRWRGAP